MNKIIKVIKKNKALISSWWLKVLVLLPGILFPSKFLHAGVFPDWMTKPYILVALILGYIFQLFLYIICKLFWIWGKAFNLVFNGSLKITEFDVITTGWGLTRDVLNMFFVIALLVIAFATILRIESYQYKVLLPKLIYAALLVNFSRTIATVMVDFSNVLMKTLLGLSKGTISETFAQVIFGKGVMQIATTTAKIPEGGDFSVVYNLIFAYVFTIMLVLGMSMAILGLTIMMLVRSLMLMILIILSPVAFVLNILPVTAQYAKKWWDEFLKYVFYGPVAAFMIYLAVLLAREVGTKISGTTKGKLDLIGDPKQVDGLMNTEGFFSILLVIAFLFMSILIIKALSPMAAGAAMGFYKRGGRLTGKAAGWGAKWAGRRVGRSLAKGKDGLIGGAVGGVAGGVAGLAGLMTGSTDRMRRAAKAGYGVGDYVRFANPKLVKDASDRIQERKDMEAYGTGTGWARTKMNRMFINKDKTDYEKQGKSGLVNEYRQELKKTYPNQKHEAIGQEFKNAVASGDLDKAEAAARLMHETGDPNELEKIARDMGYHSKRFKNGDHYDPSTMESLEGDDKEMAEALADGYSSYSMQDMYRNVFGDQRGMQIMMDVAGVDRRNGNGVMQESIQWDDESKKLKFASIKDQAKGAAIDFDKLEADNKNAQSRFTYAVEGFKDGKRVREKLQPGFKQHLIDSGPSGEQISRIARKMPRKSQEAIVDCGNDFDDVIKQLEDKGKKQQADLVKNYYDTISENTGRGNKYGTKVKLAGQPASEAGASEPQEGTREYAEAKFAQLTKE